MMLTSLPASTISELLLEAVLSLPVSFVLAVKKAECWVGRRTISGEKVKGMALLRNERDFS